MTQHRMSTHRGLAVLATLLTVAALVSAGVFMGVSGASGSEDRPAGHPRALWVGTWSASPAAAEPGTHGTGHSGRTFRNVIHTSIGGSRVRVTLSNLFGVRPLRIGHASIALAHPRERPAAAPGTLRPLTFGGSPAISIPAGGEITSDAARLPVPADADVLVSTYAPRSAAPAGPVTYHPRARQTSYAAAGDHTHDTGAQAYTERTLSWRHLTAVDVLSDRARGAVVVLGDSITDGSSSTVDANRRWPDVLADRLRTSRGAPRLGVLNQGISRNRLLTDASSPSALSRFDRDVLSRSGVRAVVVVIGVNDILGTPQQTDPARITDGLRELTRRAHARGLKVVGATVMPFGGHRGHTAERDAVRRAVNGTIRAGGVFDAVVDFDRALRDPYAPDRLRPAYDSGDHLHPSDTGYRAMGRALDLTLLG
ncbi:SGNH/GDSL hydrolase family protein [Streptomyces sp. NPDC051219]|uniref:SGNH/GDSL hydrolase family protein n=1 Tax=Streptomyces sp. NPDC051219 TaxID=3155283 RepID=UPI00344347C7